MTDDTSGAGTTYPFGTLYLPFRNTRVYPGFSGVRASQS